MEATGYYLSEGIPAAEFHDAHLLGNGQMGASVFGGVPYERILLNHDTLWSGQEAEKIHPGTREHFQQARRLAMTGQEKAANQLINDSMLGYWSESYLPLGYLNLTWGLREDRRSYPQRRRLETMAQTLQDYNRVLDLERAVERITYSAEGIDYTRELFVSRPNSILALRLTAHKGLMDFALSMESPLRSTQEVGKDGIRLQGRAPDRVESYQPWYDPKVVYLPDESSQAVRFAGNAKVVECDGRLSTDGLRLYVTGATAVVILVAIQTDYAGYRRPRRRDIGFLAQQCDKVVDNAAQKGYAALLEDHVRDYRRLYGRMEIDLGTPLAGTLHTSRRLDQLRHMEDPSLFALVAQYARYLLISFSRKGTQAGNLQGIWNPSVTPAWASNYTTNINLQMNYWCAEAFALGECHEPLLDLITELSHSGRQAARELYGMGGWVAHHNTDLWRMATVAGEDASWAWWPFGGFWLCAHLWQHYRYTHNEVFLRHTVHPILQEAAGFILDYVVKGEDGYYYTAPSTSPENKFFCREDNLQQDAASIRSGNRFHPDHSNVSAVCRASTMDLAIIRELLGNLLEAARLLGCREENEGRIKEVLENLLPFRIGRYGQLQEWDTDYMECTPGMGHVSHLYGVYPGHVIHEGTPALFEAARQSLLRRMQHGGNTSHWPGAWGICLMARFRQAALCGQMQRLMGEGLGASLLTRSNYQIDAVMGWAAGISEILLQAFDGEIHLLPALPPSWRSGRVTGMRAPGGISVAMEWKDGALTRAELLAPASTQCTVLYHGHSRAVQLEPGSACILLPQSFFA